MIKIKFLSNKEGIQEVEIKGHANSADKGKDLVCAAISAISTGILNAIDQISNNSCQFIVKEEGIIIIKVRQNSSEVQIILKTLYYQVKTIHLQYQKFISLKEVIE